MPARDPAGYEYLREQPDNCREDRVACQRPADGGERMLAGARQMANCTDEKTGNGQCETTSRYHGAISRSCKIARADARCGQSKECTCCHQHGFEEIRAEVAGRRPVGGNDPKEEMAEHQRGEQRCARRDCQHAAPVTHAAAYRETGR